MTEGITKEPELLPINGIKLAACSAGLYKKKRPDLALIAIEPGAKVAAVFTRNAFSAAPVILSRKHIQENETLFLVINAGNANAGTGNTGYLDAEKTCNSLAEYTKTSPKSILPFSTGVIGEKLPVENICEAFPVLLDSLSDSSWLEVNKAIMTTDTVAKGISRVIDIDGKKITITGIAKGSGMIKPDMATMLAFIGTDACLEKQFLNRILKNTVDLTFNRISVDGDTSTNDACVLMATGKSGLSEINSAESEAGTRFIGALNEVCMFLAQSIIRDGEGATKFVTIEVNGGSTEDECQIVATAIAHSPLIKTALFASDPNWGRILAAIGRAQISNLDINKISVYIDKLCIFDKGERSPAYTEEAGREIFKKNEIVIRVELNRGNSKLQFWTCDLSYDYVRINAEYRT